jgi:hypothetical protein
MGFGFPWVLGSTSSPEIATGTAGIAPEIAVRRLCALLDGFRLPALSLTLNLSHGLYLSVLSRSHLSASPLSQSHDLTLSFGEEKRKKKK